MRRGPDFGWHVESKTSPSFAPQTLVLVTLALLALVAACGDENEPAVDAADTKADASVAEVAAGADADAAVDVGEPDFGSAPDIEQEKTSIGLWTQIQVPGDGNASLHAVWTDGTTRVVTVGTTGTILGSDGLAWSVHKHGGLPTLHGVAGSPGAKTTFAVGMNGAIAQAKGQDGKPGTLWGKSGGCSKPVDCNDNNACTTDVCESGSCVHAASGATGCCGGVAFADSFDKGLGKWTVADLHSASGQGGIIWTAASMVGADGTPRASSPPAAAYFGRTDAPCPGKADAFCPTFDNGKVVGATMLSAPFQVPVAQKVTLTMQLRMDVAASFDQLTVSTQTAFGAKKVFWAKQTALASGSTEGNFKLVTLDLSEFSGQAIRLEISFNSQNAFNNSGEGVFIDDLLVSTTCQPGSAGQGLVAKTLFGVWAAADDDAWAVGQDGAIAHWNGKAWALASGGKNKQLFGIGGLAGGTGFAVGETATVAEVAGGLVPIAVPPGIAASLRGVAVTAPGADGNLHAVAVGDLGTVLERTGGAWTQVEVPITGTQPLRGVASLGGGAYAAVGGSQIYERKANGSWVMANPSAGVLLAVSAAGPDAAMAVGFFGTVATRVAGVWQVEPGKLSGGNLTGVHVLAADDAWVVGDSGFISHFDGQGWTQAQPSPTSINLRGVWAVAPDDVYVCGLLGSLAHFDGKAWTSMKSPLPIDWYGVWGKGKNDVYIIGQGGMLGHWNGTAWTVLNAPVTHTLRAVWGTSGKDVWAVGEKGAIYHSTGAGWVQVPIEPYQPDPEAKPYKVETTLLTVWGAAPNDVWAAGMPDFGGKGTVVHWDGKTWTYQPAMEGESRTFRAIWGFKKDRILFAGTQGMVFLFDGKEFTELKPPTIATIFGIAGYGKDALLVGDIGTVLRFTPLQ